MALAIALLAAAAGRAGSARLTAGATLTALLALRSRSLDLLAASALASTLSPRLASDLCPRFYLLGDATLPPSAALPPSPAAPRDPRRQAGPLRGQAGLLRAAHVEWYMDVPLAATRMRGARPQPHVAEAGDGVRDAAALRVGKLLEADHVQVALRLARPRRLTSRAARGGPTGGGRGEVLEMSRGPTKGRGGAAAAQ